MTKQNFRTVDALAIVAVIYLTFLGGCEQIQRAFGTVGPAAIARLTSPPQTVIVTATPSFTLAPPSAAVQMLPQSRKEAAPTVAPPAPTVAPIAAAQVDAPPAELAPAGDCGRPCIAQEVEGDPQYPQEAGHWATHVVDTPAGQQVCLYYYTKSRKVCWATGAHPTQQMILDTLQRLIDGSLPGEPIKSFG